MKHDPRTFPRLAEILGVPPSRCILLDDSPGNCAAAVACGMKSIGVYDRFYDARQEELRRSCTRYVRSLEELWEEAAAGDFRMS